MLRELKPFGGVFDLASQIQEIKNLEKISAEADFWNDPQSASESMQRLSELKETVSFWTDLQQAIHYTQELDALEDADLIPELIRETEDLEAQLAEAEFGLQLSGLYDKFNAILAIHAGAGGTDSQDWASMLLRMFLRWAERRKFKAEIYDSMEGDGAGMKSVTIGIRGRYAYGYLRSERGVHRLVRLSPFDAAHRRHTSFALVEVWPDIAESAAVVIDPKDLQIDTFRASSAGGQHMQKNDTAVRITHLPTGIIVSCQNERSQGQNKETALRILKGQLVQRQEEEHQQHLNDLKGDHVDAGWGNQIRSYVLHPYQMVKDHRTNQETGNIQAVLDGDLDAFIQAYLSYHISSQSGVD